MLLPTTPSATPKELRSYAIVVAIAWLLQMMAIAIMTIVMLRGLRRRARDLPTIFVV
jgi:hypothetical protein